MSLKACIPLLESHESKFVSDPIAQAHSRLATTAKNSAKKVGLNSRCQAHSTLQSELPGFPVAAPSKQSNNSSLSCGWQKHSTCIMCLAVEYACTTSTENQFFTIFIQHVVCCEPVKLHSFNFPFLFSVHTASLTLLEFSSETTALIFFPF